MKVIEITAEMIVGQPVDDEHCHCGSPMHGIDHCPCCGCEQHETVCASKCVCPNATDVESHWDICWEQ